MNDDDSPTATTDRRSRAETANAVFGRRTALKTAIAGLGSTVLLSSGASAASASREAGTSGDLHSLTVVANGPVDYEFTVDGTLRPDTEGGNYSADPDDVPRYVENSPDVYTVRDSTGPTPENAGGTTFYGDRYLVDYYVHLRVDPTPYRVYVYLDESPVSVDELNRMQLTTPSVHTLTVAANGPTTYELSVEPELTPDTKGGDFSADSDDAPTQNADGSLTARDSTGPVEADAGGNVVLGDRYLFSGTVEELDVALADASHDAYVYLDERPVDPDEVRGGRFS